MTNSDVIRKFVLDGAGKDKNGVVKCIENSSFAQFKVLDGGEAVVGGGESVLSSSPGHPHIATLLLITLVVILFSHYTVSK